MSVPWKRNETARMIFQARVEKSAVVRQRKARRQGTKPVAAVDLGA